MTAEESMAETAYHVVVNDEEQYSIWRADDPIPAGWSEAGVTGTRQECLDHIDRVWTDLRPRSLRLAMQRTAADERLREEVGR